MGLNIYSKKPYIEEAYYCSRGAMKNGLLWLNLCPNALSSTLNPLQLPNTCKLDETTLSSCREEAIKTEPWNSLFLVWDGWRGETHWRHAVSRLAAWFILFRGCTVTCVSHGRSNWAQYVWHLDTFGAVRIVHTCVRVRAPSLMAAAVDGLTSTSPRSPKNWSSLGSRGKGVLAVWLATQEVNQEISPTELCSLGISSHLTRSLCSRRHSAIGASANLIWTRM
jgi:hypothetical protein